MVVPPASGDPCTITPGVTTSASKSSIRRFVITEKAPTRAFSVITNLRICFGWNFLKHYYRPYFTYWVTTVQLLVLAISLALYGFGPLGVELYQGKGQVLSRGLFIEEVDFLEPSNFWVGPRPADLIHLGAKFSPCMRRDQAIAGEVATARALVGEGAAAQLTVSHSHITNILTS